MFRGTETAETVLWEDRSPRLCISAMALEETQRDRQAGTEGGREGETEGGREGGREEEREEERE